MAVEASSLSRKVCAGSALASSLPLALAMALALAIAMPAHAQSRRSLPDVPTDHWAAAAVEDVAVTHRLMPLSADGKFRGELPLNRMDFAKTMANFIQELEVQSGKSLADTSFSFYAFEDFDNASDRAIVEPIANQYNLFDKIPGVEAHRFDPKRPVTRYELAAVLDKLMSLCEKKGLITAVAARRNANNPFTDMSPLDWAYQSVLNTVLRYQIMTGFPDATFRGDTEINRYQFAAAASQAFSVVREQVSGLVRQRLPRGMQLGNRFTKFHGEDSYSLSVGTLYSFSFADVRSAEAINNLLVQQPYGGRIGPIMLSYHAVDYPVASDGARSLKVENRFIDLGLDVFVGLPQNESAPDAANYVAGEDLSVMGMMSARTWLDVPNTDPYHVQPYMGAILAPDFGIGSRTQVGLGAGPFVGMLSYFRTNTSAFSLDVGVGAVPMVAYRIPTSSLIVAPARPFLRVGLEFQFFSRSSVAWQFPKLQVFLLPGGIHGDAIQQTKNLATLAGGLTVGYSWR